MEDSELQAIRAARLKELQGAGRPAGSMSSAGLPPGFSTSKLTGAGNEEETEQRRQQDEMRRTILATVLESQARERLARIALVKPARAEQIESTLIRLAQSGQLRGKVSEQELLELLERFAGSNEQDGMSKTTITFSRRKEVEDDDFYD